MPGTSTTHDALRTFSFEESPVMSSYLLHWTVCKHKSISTVSAKGVSLTLYMPSCSKSQFFLELARDTLDFYIDYFNIPYPLPKLDIIGLVYLGFRAMENWGAITFVEHILEVIAKQWDDSKDIETATRNCRTTCHEIAHMWFGNLVTMEWVTLT
jgi:puromycin-sensitive aminopeptidase